MSNLDFKLRLDADIKKLEQRLKQAQQTAKTVGQDIEKSLTIKADDKALAKLDKGLNRLKSDLTAVNQSVKTLDGTTKTAIATQQNQLQVMQNRMNVERSAIRLAQQSAQARISAEQAVTQAIRQSAQARASANQNIAPPFPQTQIAQAIAGIAQIGAGAVGALVSVTALKEGLQSVLDTTMQFDGIEKKLAYAFGADEAVKQMQFVRDTANDLGLDVIGLGQAYGSFAASAKEMNITHAQTQQIFKGVASSAAAMGLSAEQANGAFFALSQIAAKGKVTMEELRGQLSEHMPAAMGIAAKAMGVTTAELDNLVESGLSAEVFLPKFGKALEEAFSAQATQNVASLSGQINSLKNKFSELKNWLGEHGVGDASIVFMRDIGALLDTVQAKLEAFADSPVAESLGETLSQVWSLIKEIGSGIADVFGSAYDALNDMASVYADLLGFEDVQENFSAIKTLFDGLNVSVAFLRDTLIALKVVFHGVMATMKASISKVLWGLSKISFGEMSRDFEEASKRMEESAKHSLEQAHQLAGEYGKTGEALAKATETPQQEIIRLHKEMVLANEKAQKLAKESADAQIRANLAIGTSAEETARKQAQEAQKMADEAQKSAEKSKQAWEKASGNVSEQVTVAKQELSEAQKALAESKKAINDLGLNLQNASLLQTEATTTALANIDKVNKGYHALLESGYSANKLLQGALSTATDTAQNQADIDALKAKYKELGEQGRLSALEVEQGLLSLDTKLAEMEDATNPLADAFKTLGIESKKTAELQLRQAELALIAVKASGQASEEALEKARQKVLELKNAVNPTADAFKQLGIKTKQELANLAQENIQAFETVKKSGQATQADLQKAFEQTAQSAISSGDASALAWVRSQASAYNYKVAIDDTGKASLQSAVQTQVATQQQVQAYNRVAESAKASAEAQSQASAQAVADTEKATASAESQGRKLSELGQLVHYSLKKTGAYAKLGTASWVNIIKYWQNAYISINQTIKTLNEEMERGGNIAEHLQKAEAMAVQGAKTLDKTTLSNLHQAIDKAKQKMSELSEEAQNARREAEKSLLSAQGKDDELKKLEQQEQLDALRKKQASAQRAGNQSAVADYEIAIKAQQQAYAEQARREQQQREQERLEQERQAREQAQEQARQQREAQQQRQTLSTPSSVNLNLDANEMADILQARDESVANQALNNLMKQMQDATKRST